MGIVTVVGGWSCVSRRDLRVWIRAVFREHRRDHVDYDIEFCLISRSHIDEHILRVQCDFAMLRVDDRRHRQNPVF